jgi:hypothetical protein
LGEAETEQLRTLESLVKRASKPNKKITTASQLLPVHGLLYNVFAHKYPWEEEDKGLQQENMF